MDANQPPAASRARQSVERRSAAPLLFLRQQPTWMLPVVLAALLVAGLAVTGPAGAIALGAVAAFLGWLAALSWPRLTAQGRLGRAAVVALLVAVAVIQVLR